jgi:hypothetical protein
MITRTIGSMRGTSGARYQLKRLADGTLIVTTGEEVIREHVDRDDFGTIVDDADEENRFLMAQAREENRFLMAQAREEFGV